MGDARSEILARIRRAPRPTPRPVPRDYDTARTVADPVGLFVERVEHYRAVVHRVAASDVAARIADCLRRRGARRMVAPPDLPASWQVDDVRWSIDDPPLSLDDVDGADGVVTGAAVGIAETGTIVLDAGAAQGRRLLTLVPDYHLCVVPAEAIAVSVPEALRRLDPTRPLTFVSGPSATSDIELDRVEGVHGPRTLEVLVVED
ncbi:LUD domain-containing protein [Saccharomonospora sp. NB11]|jgi:L-lactate dehydrogenase complex protein LldG|uniref:LutC/YkgG family protein n=1 Tax=Saccharomonospora sp. NB11 TaxID=1642298 RepID=UPI0018D156B5|nr:LUD domain-containing protein [Saccharomonospora sp. NB11]